MDRSRHPPPSHLHHNLHPYFHVNMVRLKVLLGKCKDDGIMVKDVVLLKVERTLYLPCLANGSYVVFGPLNNNAPLFHSK